MAIVSFRESRPTSLTVRVWKAFQLANQEAQRLNHSAIGMEHLLVGLAKEGCSPGSKLLANHGFAWPWLRQQLEAVYPPGTGEAILPGSLPYTLELRGFLEDVVEAAKTVGAYPVTPEYLLAAFLETPGEIAGNILGRRKTAFGKLRKALRRVA
jgi:ATP-dependent Clp protease ATP-binding subunit ClpC